MKKAMTKFITISDLHSKYNDIPKEWFVEADCIICAGDVTNVGYPHDAENFLKWFNKLPYKHKIFIPGNHDFCFDEKYVSTTPHGLQHWSQHIPKTKMDVEAIMDKYPDIRYLNDSGTVVNGITIWGSPISPWFHDWAFNRDRGDVIQKHWDMIPTSTDIVVTHGPCWGILDKTEQGDLTGCKNLGWEICNRIKPKYHICGHIHEAYGVAIQGSTTYINTSILDRGYSINNKHKPITFEL